MKISVFYHHVRAAAEQQGVSLEEMMQRVKALGVDYLEMDMEVADHIEETAELLSRVGLAASNVCCFYPWAKEPDNMLGDVQIRMAKAFHSDKIMPIPGLYSSEERDPAELENMLQGMKTLAKKAAEEGLRICIEDFDNELSPIATMEGMKYFTDRIPSLNVAFDTGNFSFSCENVLKAYDLLFNWIIHVHLKDRADAFRPGAPKKRTDGSLMYPCAVGDGDLPLSIIIDDLEDRRYRGIYTLEFYDVEDYWKAIQESVNYLKLFA